MRVRIVQLDLATSELARLLEHGLPPPFLGGERVRGDLELSRLVDPVRGQLDATRVLEQLPRPPPGWLTLGLLARDLFLPALTYVFGASELGRGRSVLSWARFRPDALEDQPGLLLQRTRIEAAHELGHAMGLFHCAVPTCPMHRTLSPEAIELKAATYCPTCQAELERRAAA